MSISSVGQSPKKSNIQQDQPIQTPLTVNPAVFARAVDLMLSSHSPSTSLPSITNQTEPFEQELRSNESLSILGGQYTGDTKDGIPHGRGVMLYTRDHQNKWKKYEGEWKDGHFNGVGLLKFWEGAYKQGEWKDGKLHGQGCWVTSDRFDTKYEGEWVEGDLRNGSIRDTTGLTYEGELMYTKKHGRGTLTIAQKEFYKGQWDNDKKQGLGKEINLRCGSEKDGEFREDKLYNGEILAREISLHGETHAQNQLTIYKLCEGKTSDYVKMYRFPKIVRTSNYRPEKSSEWIYFFEGKLTTFCRNDIRLLARQDGIALYKDVSGGPIIKQEKGKFSNQKLDQGIRIINGKIERVEPKSKDNSHTCAIS